MFWLVVVYFAGGQIKVLFLASPMFIVVMSLARVCLVPLDFHSVDSNYIFALHRRSNWQMVFKVRMTKRRIVKIAFKNRIKSHAFPFITIFINYVKICINTIFFFLVCELGWLLLFFVVVVEIIYAYRNRPQS